MDITCAESKVNYEQIQNYVLEKYGFKVSNSKLKSWQLQDLGSL